MFSKRQKQAGAIQRHAERDRGEGGKDDIMLDAPKPRTLSHP